MPVNVPVAEYEEWLRRLDSGELKLTHHDFRWYRVLVVLAYSLGCRRGELLGLTWRDSVDLDGGTVTIWSVTSKGRSERTLPLTPDLVEMLRSGGRRILMKLTFCPILATCGGSMTTGIRLPTDRLRIAVHPAVLSLSRLVHRRPSFNTGWGIAASQRPSGSTSILPMRCGRRRRPGGCPNSHTRRGSWASYFSVQSIARRYESCSHLADLGLYKLLPDHSGHLSPLRIYVGPAVSEMPFFEAPERSRHFQRRIVREAGLEPAQVALLDPKSSASANSATLACLNSTP